MRRRALWAAALASQILAVGCEAPEPSAPAPSTPAGPRTGYEARYDAAVAIQGDSQRESALAALAADAAGAGAADIVLKCVEGIGGAGPKGETAAAAALELVKQGQPDGARQVALKISAASRRDTVLAAIARNGQ